MRSRTTGPGNTPLMTRMIVAIIVTVLAALLLYFVFLSG
jgi:cell division protein FtsN